MKPAQTPTIHALIPAGGVGARAHTDGEVLPKQYRLIGGRPMLSWAVDALLQDSRVCDVVIGVQPGDSVATVHLGGLAKVRLLPSAGETRALTVLKTLNASGFGDDDWVLVHDAARPGLPAANLTALIDACLEHQRPGLLAMPAADTVKQASPSTTGQPACVGSTLPREAIWLAQTPQMSRVVDLRAALTKALAAGVAITDEASALEWAGLSPLLVKGASRNNKITWAEDFVWIQAWLQHP